MAQSNSSLPDDADCTESLSGLSLEEMLGKTPDFRPVLLLTNGADLGVRHTLVKQRSTIGRSRRADFIVHDNGVSREHVAIYYENFDQPREVPRCYVEDLGSRNGTLLNRRPINGRERLRERDRITLGTTTLGFFFRDAEELMQDEYLYELATRDPLTGLDNRRQFVACLKHYLGLAHRGRSNISLMLIDLDDFKKMNDTYGHAAGDLVLVHIAEILSTSVRNSDLVARWGGEEFVVCLPETDLENAQQLAGRLRQEIETTRFRYGSDEIRVTASFGICQFEEADTEKSVFEKADRCLYAAKAQGKNCVVTVDHEAEPSG